MSTDTTATTPPPLGGREGLMFGIYDLIDQRNKPAAWIVVRIETYRDGSSFRQGRPEYLAADHSAITGAFTDDIALAHVFTDEAAANRNANYWRDVSANWRRNYSFTVRLHNVGGK